MRLWTAWIAEGDAAGDPETGEEWAFYGHGCEPDIGPGERVYVVANGRLRGYAPLVRLAWDLDGLGPAITFARLAFVRRGAAVAVTVPDRIVGFRGWRYRWWPRSAEVPFPDWKIEGVMP
jgi:hypothetical protein